MLLLVCSNVCGYSLTWLLPTCCSTLLFPACYSFAWFPLAIPWRGYSSVLVPNRSSLTWFPACFVVPHNCSPTWLLLTCYSPAWLPTYYSPCGYNMSLPLACCSPCGYSLFASVSLNGTPSTLFSFCT